MNIYPDHLFPGAIQQLHIDSDGEVSVKIKKNSQMRVRNGSQYRPSNNYRGQNTNTAHIKSKRNTSQETTITTMEATHTTSGQDMAEAMTDRIMAGIEVDLILLTPTASTSVVDVDNTDIPL